ncbi:phosphotyrosine protein phosphatase [Vibrio parahaemolyticus]|uniref:arsenate reductase/protein-tyrosine-phosphatase family protein n=1 Tax=Vibrio parahaemolyticus TaxID=670 RepID=UPI000870E81C|nr:phosphotyrosine protein phosphatase [Vibrio parahaemolyticus]AOV92744.1 Phosphotyrosine protein phosphatase [Vibrio parahaemolyticus]TOD33832.1 phosphotyrosine protein phosphatase [Vibrio parahaemolyticus]
MFSNILVVCVGNICRSPTGERLLQSLLPNKQVASAGLAVHKSHLSGKPADQMATNLASEHGISLDGHEAQQLTPELCAQYDLILVMEKGHLEALTKIAPEARGKTMLFGQWIEEKNIPDPYRQSREAFEHAYALIEKAALAWSKKL